MRTLFPGRFVPFSAVNAGCVVIWHRGNEFWFALKLAPDPVGAFKDNVLFLSASKEASSPSVGNLVPCDPNQRVMAFKDAATAIIPVMDETSSLEMTPGQQGKVTELEIWESLVFMRACVWNRMGGEDPLVNLSSGAIISTLSSDRPGRTITSYPAVVRHWELVHELGPGERRTLYTHPPKAKGAAA